MRNFNVGHYDPERPDRFVNEMTAYNTRHWFFDPTPRQQRWKFNEGLTIDAVEMPLSDGGTLGIHLHCAECPLGLLVAESSRGQ